MRAYINGKLSTPQECFLPAGLWLANTSDDYDLDISENVLRLDGIEIESSLDEDKTKFTCRWKGVSLVDVDENGNITDKEIYNIEDLLKIIKSKNMSLVNMDAFFDTKVKAAITSIELVDSVSDFSFDLSSVEPIEFIP